MLVLTRKANQSIRVGKDITITIVKIQGNSIRIGIEAPREVRVVRGELGPQTIEKTFAEFDLDDLDAESFAALAAASDDQPSVGAHVIQMRTATPAPLARFLPTAVRENLSSYSH